MLGKGRSVTIRDVKSVLTFAIASLLLISPGDPVQIGFEILADFDYAEGMELPLEVVNFDEQKVVIPGFMQAEDETDEDVEFFMLINDACGCEGTPKLNEIVFCEMPEGETTRILPGNVKITGTLLVGEERLEDVVIGIYFLQVDKIE